MALKSNKNLLNNYGEKDMLFMGIRQTHKKK